MKAPTGCMLSSAKCAHPRVDKPANYASRRRPTRVTEVKPQEKHLVRLRGQGGVVARESRSSPAGAGRCPLGRPAARQPGASPPALLPTQCPAVSTVHAVLDRHGLVSRRGTRRQRAQGTALTWPEKPNALSCAEISCADDSRNGKCPDILRSGHENGTM
jgi:hypothetical protein